MKVTLRSSDVVNLVLKKSKMLRTKEGYKAIYLCPDRTVEERKAFKILLKELKIKRRAETDSDKVLFIKKHKIIALLIRKGVQYQMGRFHFNLLCFYFHEGPC